MSFAAAEDWEATGYIFDDDDRFHRTTTLDTEGGLLRGSIDLAFDLSNVVFCRCVPPMNPQHPRYRFWTLPPIGREGPCLRFRVVFGCKPSCGDPADDESSYARLDVSLLSDYPPSFPHELKMKWLDWLQKAAFQILQEEQISYSVCNFVENHALDYFTHLLRDEGSYLALIRFDDEGPLFYDTPTLMSSSSVKRLRPLQIHFPSGRYYTMQDTSELSEKERAMVVPLMKRWRDWLPTDCPICLDTFFPKDAVVLPCNHGFCKSCMTSYLGIKAAEIRSSNPNNPFVCPLNSCHHGLKIVGFVKPFLSENLMDRVRAWVKDIKTPPCHSLPGCLKKDCKGRVLRKDAADSAYISCEKCGGRWCELCLQRAPMGEPHEDTPSCKVEICLQFCERYLAAGDRAKEKCEERFPWIKLYAHSKAYLDRTIIGWIKNNAQICPGCKTGVERVEGCFHMSCGCGTHFCYECGEQLFPPFYGTHHCWEREQVQWGDQFHPVY